MKNNNYECLTQCLFFLFRVKVDGPKTGEDSQRQPFRSSIPFLETDQDPAFRRSPLESLYNLMLEPRVDCFQQNMFSSDMIISDSASDLSAKGTSRAGKRQLGSVQDPCPPAQGKARHTSLSIKDKISEWEGKRELPTPAPGRKADGQEGYLMSCVTERRPCLQPSRGLKTQRTNAILYALLDRGVCLVGYVSPELSVSALSSPRTFE